MKRVLLIIALIALLLIALPVLAQEVTPEPPLTPGLDAVPVTPSGWIAVFTFFGGSVAVSGIVSLLKLIPGNTLSATTLKEWVAVVVTLVYMIAVLTGQHMLFEQGADLFNQLLPFVAGLIGVFQGSSALHDVSAAYNVPLLGNKRTYTQRE